MYSRGLLLRPVLALLLLLRPAHWLVAADTEIIQYPNNVTAALGTNVTVVCIADQRELAWEVNRVQIRSGEDLTVFMGLVLDVGATQVVGDNRYRSTITFPASERANSTIRTIVCQAGPSVFLLEDGETVTFCVYGLPLAPVELEVMGDTAHQLRVGWGPPFTLPGETLSYSLLIEDLATGQNETVEPLTDTVYTHSLSETEALACHTFRFSVSSVNDVGLSLNSSSAEAIHPSAPGPVGVVQSTVLQNSLAPAGSQATVQLNFQTPITCYPLTYNVTLRDEEAGSEVVVVPSSGSTTETVVIPGLRENARYTATVSAYNHFQFSVDNPVQAEPISFVTSGVQSVSVLHFENETLRITCTFAEGTASEGCSVILTFTALTTTTITLPRSGDALEVVRYAELTRGVPSMVEARDINVSNPVIILGTIFTDGTPRPLTSSQPFPPSTTTSTSDSLSATPTTGTDKSSSSGPMTSSQPSATPTTSTDKSSGPNILTWAVPGAVGVAIIAVLVLLACCFICCRGRTSKYATTSRRDTLPYDLPLPNSPSFLTSQHDYKQVTSHVSGTIKEMSFNPLYGDHSAPSKTFDPPLPALPQPTNGQPIYPHNKITLPSTLPPVYEQISVKQDTKLAANPQYGAVGGANGATPNPQYVSSPSLDKASVEASGHMYASLQEPGALPVQQKLSSQYAQPYEHVRVLQPPAVEGVVITTDDNVSYNVSPTASAVSPQKSP